MAWSFREPDYPYDPDAIYDVDEEISRYDDPAAWDDDVSDECYGECAETPEDNQGCDDSSTDAQQSDRPRNKIAPDKNHGLAQHRADIAELFRLNEVASRMAKGASLGAASAAFLSLLIQLLSDEPVDVSRVGKDAGKGALLGGGRVLTDVGIYHLAAEVFGIAPEEAVVIARQGGAAAFCSIAIGADVWSEIKAVRSGELSSEDAVAGSVFKAGLDLVPFLVAPLGLAGIPVFVLAQIGGRWLIAKARLGENERRQTINKAVASSIAAEKRHEAIMAECAQTDLLFESVMRRLGSHMNVVQ